MKLPNADGCRVDEYKIRNYLLSRSHPDGASKAEFFERFGFKISAWHAMAKALCNHGRNNNVVKTVVSAYGVRYIVEGHLDTPSGRRPVVRSVWIVEKETEEPRLITAYPA